MSKIKRYFKNMPSLTKFVVFSFAVIILYTVTEFITSTVTGIHHDTLMKIINSNNLTQYDNGKASEITQNQTAAYVPGKIYVLQSDLYVRDNPNGIKLKFDALMEDGKKNGLFDDEGSAILRKGTRVTCKAVSGNWMLIPSGWVCIKNSKGTYII